MRLNDIAGLSFDLDDTLWPFNAAVLKAEAALYQWLRHQAPATAGILSGPEQLRQFRNDLAVTCPAMAHDPALLRRTSIRNILVAAGENPDLADAGYDLFYAERQKVTFFDDALPALKYLSRHYPLAAISNGNADLAAIGIDHFFEARFFAHQLGIAKPDARIFHASARALNIAPSNMLHVGDDIELDVRGALLAGCKAAWLVRDRAQDALASADDGADTLIIQNLHQLCDMLG